jgi:hypothetical protein
MASAVSSNEAFALSRWRRWGVASIAAALAMVPASASASETDKHACIDASEKAQLLRNDGKLREARDQLFVCVRDVCPAPVSRDCGRWLPEVLEALPSIVVLAKDPDGDLFDVAVDMDGRPLAARLDGRAVNVDPGRHVFRFKTPDGRAVERSLMIVEGQKDRRLEVELPRAGLSLPSAEPLPAPASAPRALDGRRLTAIVLGGAGVASVALGSVFGALTFSAVSRQRNDCGTAETCNLALGSSDHSAAETDAAASTVLFVAGAGLLGSGALLFFTAPSQPPRTPAAATVRLLPSVSGRGGSLSVLASF